MTNVETVEAHGGDLVETVDGRRGFIRMTSYSLVGKETVYGLVDGESQFDAPISTIARIIQHGRHDYRPNPTHRGHCKRCNVPKANHAG